ncbi:adenylate kinase [Bogoriella caseilytica]|uniref:Adenylate kinase n=1 Tax=Bogoriella caseilytica TaxID=56055 RepID=A0A3N2BE99_9MICO|nr:adenylate kinase [Bogoriella caseilytica]ROR73545.1 adenylate kinase [Bogoriella caseilytica]
MSARLIIMGPQGAGKGTQAARLADRLGVPTISTGDMFRSHLAERSELGQRAQRYMDAGELVPDEITDAMVRERLAQPDAAEGFILDGYPRNAAQAQVLESILAESGIALNAAIELTADTDEVVERLLKRAEEQGRADDTEPVIRRRLAVYAEQTAPLAALYAEKDLLVQVDGVGEMDEVTERLLAALEPKL